MMTFVHIKGAFLRLDWVVCLVVSTCLLKKGWYKTAGALMAYSALARVFPAIFLFGIGVKFGFRCLNYAVEAVRSRKFRMPDATDWRYVAFFLAFAIAAALLMGVTTWSDGDLHRWESFSKKIAIHNNDISTTRVGFKYIFLSPFKTFDGKGVAFQQHQMVWKALMALFLLLAVFPARKIEDYETIPYGFVPAFFLTAPTFYYYVMLIVPLLFFAPKIHRLPRAAGLAGMFAMTVASFVLNRYYPLEFQLCFLLSCMLQALVIYMLVVAFWTREAKAVELAPEPVGGTEPEPPVTAEPTVRTAAQSKPKHKAKSKGKVKRAEETVAARVARESDKAGPAPAGSVPSPASKFEIRDYLWIGGIVFLVAAGLLVWAVTRSGAPRKSGVIEREQKDEATLVFVGDVMFSRNVAAAIGRHNNDYTFPFQFTEQYLRAADMSFCNLECPVTERGELVTKNYTFRASPQCLTGLKSAGIGAVSVANNHVLDYGPLGLEDTLNSLAQSQITYVGICTNDEPQTPAIFDLRGIRVGYLAYADPVPTYSYAKEFLAYPTRPAKGEKATIQADIARLRPQVDVVIVSIHWGVEYQTSADAWQHELGQFIIDAGADIVAGHHPHVQQDPELYKKGLIIYSMGNFVFDQHTRPATRLSRLYRVYVNKQGLVRAEYLPLEISDKEWQPTPTAQKFVPVAASQQQPE
jgi:poly-gamma-glutamate synthesis protein (capsule biosynthesis protein)